MKKIFFLIQLVIFTSLFGCSSDNSSKAKEVSSEASKGAQLVKANCKVCHAQGINGAPIIGNKKMWGPRLDKGLEALVANATNGVGLMPAKGGSALTDEEIAVAVEYMVKQVSN